MTNISPHSPNDQWKALVEEFTSFGGVATNVMQREGKFGLGLFPIDASKPVKLHVPDELLVSTENVELRDGGIVIKDPSNYPKGFDDWYRRFQADYSWGAEAQKSIREFETGLKSLPDRVRILFRNLGIANIESRFSGADEEQNILNRFLATRRINRHEKAWLMPMIELVNHSPNKPSWGMKDQGITVEGTFDDEIMVRYSVADPLSRLVQYGFNCQEPTGFSMGMKVRHQNKTILINGGVNYSPLSLPSIEINDDEIKVDKLLIGMNTNPRMPRTLIRKLFADTEGVNADELFDQIHFRNRIGLIQILRELEDLTSNTAAMLKNACRDQLIAIGYHFGVRDINDIPD